MEGKKEWEKEKERKKFPLCSFRRCGGTDEMWVDFECEKYVPEGNFS